MRKLRKLWGNYWYETDRLKPKLRKERVFSVIALSLVILVYLVTFLK